MLADSQGFLEVLSPAGAGVRTLPPGAWVLANGWDVEPFSPTPTCSFSSCPRRLSACSGSRGRRASIGLDAAGGTAPVAREANA